MPFTVFAQSGFVASGRVTGAQNNPLSGATVSVANSNNSTVTDATGNFSIRVSNGARLVISHVGYAPKTVNAAESMNVSLDEENTTLSEVVVTGLATTTRRGNAANAVATISAKQLTGSTRSQTLDAAMQGKVAGVQITSNSGAPGGGFLVRLRGASSLTQSAEPLYIIDGVYMDNSQFGTGAGTNAFTGAARTPTGSQDNSANRIADINPQDIENIEILKGPSAAAIYGTRANAGVILITTKKGRAGKLTVNFGQDVGFAKALKLIGLHKTKWDKQFQFGTELANAARLTTLKSTLNPTDETWDYEKIVYGNTGALRNTRLALSGGTDKIRFYAGGNVMDEQGIQKNTGYSKNSFRLNVDLKPTSFIDIAVGANYINSNSDRSFSGNDNNGVAIGYNLAYLPNWLPQLPVNGVYPKQPLTGQNPLEIVDRTVNNEKVNRMISNYTVGVQLVKNDIHNLRLTSTGGVDFLTAEDEVYIPDDVQFQAASANPGASRYTTNRALNTNLQGFLVYNAHVGNFSFTTSAGLTQLRRDVRLNYFQGQGLKPAQRNPSTGTVQQASETFQGEKELGRVVQEEINWNDIVIATAGVRQDRSTLNGDPKKYFTFPKASLAVNVANFGFWKIPAISQLKLRAAYGETGRSASFNSTFTTLTDLIIGGQAGAGYPTILGNAGIEPERATEFETGVDIGAFSNRLRIEFTVYNKKVKNLIESYNLSTGTGVSSIQVFPVGDLQNKGIELSLGGTPVRSRNVTWNTNINWWRNRSLMTRLIIPEKVVASSGFGSFGTQRLREGASPTAWYGTPNVNGVPTLYEDSQPLWQASWSNSITFLRNFEFSILIHRSHKNFNSTLNQEITDEGGSSPDWSTIDKDNNPLGQSRKLGKPGITTRQFIVDASYTKIREISLYYTVPKTIFGSFANKFESIRVGVSGNNIAMWTPYYGYDPEAANFGNRPTGATVDLLSFPSSKRFFFHFNVNF
ncbi:SusC/RagA family TonB-linked outer membrane protein [Segetibacter aerophilus]|uniref:SusC/RagA family TonB-linked outer membrane protein n=2 Tax=Segetibacter aerophilus TaxID=670293 RepID=A0A512BB00_9BACT|nr:SusC/RagA family TonB-linked outer membrane protein [Segetibacter aerophilus]